MTLTHIAPIMFFIAILFGISFSISYAIFEKNIVIMLGIFNLLLILALTIEAISYIMFPVWFLTMGIMIYLEFGVSKKE